MSSARWLVGVIVCVVLAFLVTTAVSESVESNSSRLVEDIVGNAMPSVQLLATARGDLRRLDRDVQDLATSSGARTSGLVADDQVASNATTRGISALERVRCHRRLRHRACTTYPPVTACAWRK